MVQLGVTQAAAREPRSANATSLQINELKKTWTQGQQDDASDQAMRLPLSHTVDGSSLLFDQVKPLERIGIISTLPPKHEVDWLITQFFNRATFPLAIPRK